MLNAHSSGRRLELRWLAASVVMALGAVLCVAAAPAKAAPAVTISAYEITSDLPDSSVPGIGAAATSVPTPGPSTFQAGAHPSAGSYSAFTYTNATEDLKTAITNFGPGLLGNPESVPKCPQAALVTGGATCPAGSAIGTSRLDTVVSASGGTINGPTISGTLYNAELLGNEPGRLAAVSPLGGGVFLVSSIPFTITPRGNGDYGLTGTLTDINRLSAATFGTDLQVRGLSFVINASSGYVRNPTSCEINTSTGQAVGYDDPTVVEGPAYSFVTTGCEQLPFTPTLSLQVGDRGTTRVNGYPPVVITIKQTGDQADEMGNKITLPVELNSNNTAYTLCSQAQADADSCPAGSKFGFVTATSPFLGEPLKGPVYLIQQTATTLPGLLLDLQGRAHVKIQTKTSLINGKQIQSLVLNAPQLPISSIVIALNGGRKTGVFQNRQDLCFKGKSTSRFNPVTGLVKHYGWNGKQTGDIKYTATVNGCGPAVKSRLTGATGGRPSLTITATDHVDSPNFKTLSVKLGGNLALSKSRLDRGSADGGTLTYVNRHRFTVSGLPAAGLGKLTIRLSKGAVRVSRHSRNLLKRGKSRSFKVKVSPTPLTGKGTSTQATFRVKGKRR